MAKKFFTRQLPFMLISLGLFLLIDIERLERLRTKWFQDQKIEQPELPAELASTQEPVTATVEAVPAKKVIAKKKKAPKAKTKAKIAKTEKRKPTAAPTKKKSKRPLRKIKLDFDN